MPDMLILSNDDVRAVLPMAEALGALEQAYRDFANGLAHGTTTRLDTRVTLSDTGRFFSFYQRSHVTVVNSKAPFGNERAYLTHTETDWAQYPDLGDLVTGRVAGRSNETAITFFMNNAGLGFQFAACGAKAYELARERGLGHEIPSEWLLQPMSAWTAARDKRIGSET